MNKPLTNWQVILVFLSIVFVTLFFLLIRKIYYYFVRKQRYYIFPKISVKGITNIAMVISISVATILLLTIVTAGVLAIICRAYPGWRVTIEGILIKIGGLLFGPIIGIFIGGTKELPLIGNEAFILTPEKIHKIHNIAPEKSGDLIIQIASSEQDDVQINFPIDGLFNSHIAIFGNTGSGKSNTLAALYQNLFCQLNTKNSKNFNEKCHFVLFDFNGEYTTNWFQNNTKILNLSTQNNESDKIQIKTKDLLDIETFSILVEATEKTQKPFLKRTILYYEKVSKMEDKENYLKNILRRNIIDLFLLPEKNTSVLLLDYIKEILPPYTNDEGELDEIIGDLHWFNKTNEYVFKRSDNNYSSDNYRKVDANNISETRIYKHIEKLTFTNETIKEIIKFLYLQLISDVLSNRANNEHIAPVINRLKSRQKDIAKVCDKIF